MTPAEDLVRSTTRAIADTVTEAPPLRLSAPPHPLLAAPSRRARRKPNWLAPLAAAVAVAAIAVSLVVVKDASTGRTPPSADASAAADAVPRYYVALKPAATTSSSIRNALVVGDALTGSTLATIQPPAGRSFFGVTGAADDRTFVVDTLPVERYPDPIKPRTWYLLRLAPGTTTPARLTRLALPALSSVSAVALSRSGDELAIASGGSTLVGAKGEPGVLRLYSVATGKLLRTWTSNDQFAFDGFPGYGETAENNGDLTWVDDDHAIAFLSAGGTPGATPQQTRRTETMHVLSLAARGDSLLGDSRAIWSQTQTGNGNPAGCSIASNVLITADLKTIICLSVAYPAGYPFPPGSPKKGAHFTVRWLAYSTSAPATARTLYTATLSDEARYSAAVVFAQWISGSGKTFVAEWYVTQFRHAPAQVKIGAISDGRLTSLPVPVRVLSGLEPDINLAFGLQQSFAWLPGAW